MPTLKQLGRAINQAKKQEREQKIIVLPFYPNPGSQSVLFFDILGFEKGQPKQLNIDENLYPDWMRQEILENVYNSDRPINITYEPIPKNHKHELDFICYTAGNGTGKSNLGAAFVYYRSILTPNTRGLITANSYPQLKDSTLTVLAEFCQTYNIPLEIVTQGKRNDLNRLDPEDAAKAIANANECRVNGKYYLVRSADSYQGGTAKAKQTGRGPTLTEIWGDELLRLPDSSVINTMLTRLRGKSGVKPIGLITSTLNTDKSVGGWDDLLFHDPDRNEETKRRFIELSGVTHENRHNLDPDYVPRLKAALTPELYDLEVLGKRVAISEGKIFSYFSRKNHCTSLTLDPNYPIYFSLDFNHNPITAIAGQWIKGELLIIREWFLLNSDSFKMGETLSLWLKESVAVGHKIYLHGDATGNSKTANSKKTNWQIINEELKAFSPKTLYGQSNPGVLDTIHSVNCALNNRKIFLDNNCKELIKDLESLQYNSNGEIDKKKDLMRSHLADTLRYLCNHLMPYQSTSKGFIVNQVRGY
jgi:hypothetical protein